MQPPPSSPAAEVEPGVVLSPLPLRGTVRYVLRLEHGDGDGEFVLPAWAASLGPQIEPHLWAIVDVLNDGPPIRLVP